MDEQPPLPDGWENGGSVLDYVQYMKDKQQQQHQELITDIAEDGQRIAAYIKGGAAGWQEREERETAESHAVFERTLQL